MSIPRVEQLAFFTMYGIGWEWVGVSLSWPITSLWGWVAGLLGWLITALRWVEVGTCLTRLDNDPPGVGMGRSLTRLVNQPPRGRILQGVGRCLATLVHHPRGWGNRSTPKSVVHRCLTRLVSHPPRGWVGVILGWSITTHEVGGWVPQMVGSCLTRLVSHLQGWGDLRIDMQPEGCQGILLNYSRKFKNWSWDTHIFDEDVDWRRGLL